MKLIFRVVDYILSALKTLRVSVQNLFFCGSPILLKTAETLHLMRGLQLPTARNRWGNSVRLGTRAGDRMPGQDQPRGREGLSGGHCQQGFPGRLGCVRRPHCKAEARGLRDGWCSGQWGQRGGGRAGAPPGGAAVQRAKVEELHCKCLCTLVKETASSGF